MRRWDWSHLDSRGKITRWDEGHAEVGPVPPHNHCDSCGKMRRWDRHTVWPL